MSRTSETLIVIYPMAQLLPEQVVRLNANSLRHLPEPVQTKINKCKRKLTNEKFITGQNEREETTQDTIVTKRAAFASYEINYLTYITATNYNKIAVQILNLSPFFFAYYISVSEFEAIFSKQMLNLHPVLRGRNRFMQL
jgi:hypothetical protein